jgi:sucrose phosphorylase
MKKKNNFLNGVMFNAYPDSIGDKLSDALKLLRQEEFDNAFSYFYILPTFFNSDLDRGFSIIDYNINKDLVSEQDLEEIKDLDIKLKFDIVLNHLSVASPQFKDLLEKGEKSEYKDFFINWNSFWKSHGRMNDEGIIIPDKEYLDQLFMRKAGLPVLKVNLPNGAEEPYWNTFYQKTGYKEITLQDLQHLGLAKDVMDRLIEYLNKNLSLQSPVELTEFELSEQQKSTIKTLIDNKKYFLGQMDVNANSPLVWDFYRETLEKLKNYGCKILRLDAFAYLHKAIGESNFFNTPGTWDYLERLNDMAKENDIKLLPEIHAEYGSGLHKAVAQKGYMIYDFFLPGLLIHTLEAQDQSALIKWIKEILENDYKTVNMLGCHDGIPVLDLKGKVVNGVYQDGLIEDEAIEQLMAIVLKRGGKVKNLYGPDGKKVSYYQINATFFSALGESEKKLILARAIQVFMPGIPQVWYLDLFAGKNDHDAVERAGEGGHKEINRTNLDLDFIKENLNTPVVKKQLDLLRFRNSSKAFSGKLSVKSTKHHVLDMFWENGRDFAHLVADLKTLEFKVSGYSDDRNENFELY